MCRLNIYDFFIQNKHDDFWSEVFRILWLERIHTDRSEVKMLFASVRNICVENQKRSWQMKHAVSPDDKHSKSKIIFMKLKIWCIQNHLYPVGKSACFASKRHFSQHFNFVHTFHIKFNKYVRTCKRKLRSELVPRWTNWIMGDTAAVISKLSYYFLLRNSNLKWPNPISLLKTIFEMC